MVRNNLKKYSANTLFSFFFKYMRERAQICSATEMTNAKVQRYKLIRGEKCDEDVNLPGVGGGGSEAFVVSSHYY